MGAPALVAAAGCKDKEKAGGAPAAGGTAPSIARATCDSFMASKTPDDPLVKSMRAQIACAKNGAAACDEYKSCVEKIGQ